MARALICFIRITICMGILLASGGLIFALVEIRDNGYTGLKIAIHRSVEDKPELVTALKEILKKASTNLYAITKKRAYFKDVTIIVPSTWKSQPGYIEDDSDECLKCAEIHVAPPSTGMGDIPYTYQPNGCGERGLFIHFTPNFILKSLSRRPRESKVEGCVECKKKSRIFVHEWAHLRYGVFNEDDDPNHNQKFYKSKNNTIEVSGCAQSLYGRLRKSLNSKEKCPIDKYWTVGECVFFPDVSSGVNNKSKVSLMYLPEMDSEFVGFCGDDEDEDGTGLKHNPDAPNKHNRMCKGRSTMNITLENEDFKDGRNGPQIIPNTTPQITVLHKKKNENGTSSPFVFVLDISTSMEGRPIQYLQDATKRFIKYNAKPQCPIGMVSFGLKSKVLANLTTITDESREHLVKIIPSKLEPATAIGKGLLTAIEVLRLPDGKIQKGKIILITDGEENIRPMIKSIKEDIKNSGVTIYTVAFGKEASSKLEELTTLTGGKGWQFKLDGDTKSLDSSLNEIGLTCGGEEEEEMKPFINKNGVFFLGGNQKIEGTCAIDKSMGQTEEVTVLFTYEFMNNKTTGKPPEIQLISPTNKIYTVTNDECSLDEDVRVIRCRFSDAEDGTWAFEMKSGPDPITVNLMITTDIVYEKGKPTDIRPIRVDSWISAGQVEFPKAPKVFARVLNDTTPVLRAKVLSTLYRPNGDNKTIQLFDNGQDPDVDADDGTYTAYIVQFHGSGRYAVDTNVVNEGDARLLANVPGSKAPVLHVLPPEEEVEEAKLDFPTTDFETVNYIISTTKKIDYDQLEPAGVFERFVTGGTFMLNNWVEGDFIPPSQIRDLTAEVIDPQGRKVELQWLSPGDDMNDGQATAAEIRYHQDSLLLINSFDEAFNNFTLVNGSFQPPQPHEKHSIILQLPEDNDLLNEIHFAVRVYDDVQNAGDVSNTAFVSFALLNTTSVASSNQPKLENWTTYIILGAVLIVIAIAVVTILVYKQCRRAGYKSPDESRKVEMSALTEKSEDVP